MFEEQKKTKEEIINLLNEKNKCMVIRPTGFGKTYIATELIHTFDKVLYVYPADIIKSTVEERYCEIDMETIETQNALSSKCDMITYAKLSRITSDEIDELVDHNYDLLIFDECHRMGAKKSMKNILRIMNHINFSSKYVGLTATPVRSDGMDISSIFFNDVSVYEYTLTDAINDGIINMPNYVYCKYDSKLPEKFRDTLLDINNEYGDDVRYKAIKRRIFEVMKLDEIKMSDVIGDYCREYLDDISYMKFLVFFSSIKQMDDYFDDVISWFRDAFSDYEIETLRVSSKNKEESENVAERLNKLTRKEKVIHLIGSIDMLNLGYHVENSGILMYRGTSSSIIYSQQFGRALSVGSKNTPLVFDVVDNIHRKAIYELRPEHKKNMYLTEFELDGTDVVLFDSETGDYISTMYHMNENGDIVDENGEPTKFVYDEDSGFIYEIIDKSKNNNPNIITPECLNPVGNVATAKEILAKIEGEKLAQKCKWVLEAHFRSWCFNNNIFYPLSKTELEKFYNKDINQFYNWFKMLLKYKKIPYPINDIEKLLYIGTDDKSLDTSLDICCAKKSIPVQKVLEVLQIS